MSLETNRDYSTQLAKHQEIMDRLIADFPHLGLTAVSKLALKILWGRTPYPEHQQPAGILKANQKKKEKAR